MTLDIHMPCFHTTLMGVIRGVLDYYALPGSDAFAYGASGHAFVMNIHEELCPSGPYCWNREGFFRLVRNLGVETTDHGFFSQESPAAERQAVESVLRKSLESGEPCALVNMEYQLITGCDETGFFTAQPWAPHVNFPPAHLTFGSWAEFGSECHVNFFTFRKTDPASETQAIRDSLAYALDLYHNPTSHSCEPYSVGDGAYARWIAAVESGHGASHGSWWNATVWSECRRMASAYFAEIAAAHPAVAPAATRLAGEYGAIAVLIGEAADKGMASGEKLALLKRSRAQEARCVEQIQELSARFA